MKIWDSVYIFTCSFFWNIFYVNYVYNVKMSNDYNVASFCKHQCIFCSHGKTTKVNFFLTLWTVFLVAVPNPVPLMEKGCLWFKEGLCFVPPEEGSIVGSVANVERLSTPSSQRRFCMPLSYPSTWVIQFYKIKSIHFNRTAWCQNNWYYVADRTIEFQSDNLELTHSNFFSLISKNSSPRFDWRGIIFIEC